MHWLFLLPGRERYRQVFHGGNPETGKNGKEKKVRLDILGTNTAAERLYTGCGFRFVQAKDMFYEDTGWTEYKMYERVL